MKQTKDFNYRINTELKNAGKKSADFISVSYNYDDSETIARIFEKTDLYRQHKQEYDDGPNYNKARIALKIILDSINAEGAYYKYNGFSYNVGYDIYGLDTGELRDALYDVFKEDLFIIKAKKFQIKPFELRVDSNGVSVEYGDTVIGCEYKGGLKCQKVYRTTKTAWYGSNEEVFEYCMVVQKADGTPVPFKLSN